MNRSVPYNSPMPTVYGDTYHHIDEMVDSTVGAEIRRGKELQNQKKKLKNSRIDTKRIIYNNEVSNSVKSISNRKSKSYSQKIRDSIQRLTQPLNRNYNDLAYNSNKVIPASQRTIEKRKSIPQRSPPGFSVAEGSKSFRNKSVKSQTTNNPVHITHENKKNIDNAQKNHRTRKKSKNEEIKNEKEATYARSFCIMFAHRVAEELLPSYEVNLFGRLKYLSSVLREEICSMTTDERNSKKDKNLDILRKNLVDEIANRTAIWINVVMEEAFSKLAEDELRVEMNKLFSVPCLGNDVRSTQQQRYNNRYHLDLEEQVGPVFEFLDDLIDNVGGQLHSDEEMLPSGEKRVANENKKRGNIKEKKYKKDPIMNNLEESNHLKDIMHKVSRTSRVEVTDKLANNGNNEVADEIEHLVREVGLKVKDEESEVDDELEDDVHEVGDKVVDFYTSESDRVISLDLKEQLNENISVTYEENQNENFGSAVDDVFNLTELINEIVGAGTQNVEKKLQKIYALSIISDSEGIPDDDTTKDNVIKFIDEVMNNLDDDDSQVQTEVSSEDITFGIESDIDSKHQVPDSALSNWSGDLIETLQEMKKDILDVEIESSDLNTHLDNANLNAVKNYSQETGVGVSESAFKMTAATSALRHLKAVAIEQQDYVEISDYELKKITNFSEVANAINQISSIHESIPVESNVRAALEDKLLKLIDDWCPENMDETMGQTINYVSGEVASWLNEKQQSKGKIYEELPQKNLTSSMHSIVSGSSTRTGLSDQSEVDQGLSLVEDIQIPFRDSTPSTEEIRVFQSSHFKSTSSVMNDFCESDSMSSRSSIVTLKLDLSVTSELPIEQDLLAKEIKSNITNKQANGNHENIFLDNKEELLTLLSSQLSSSCSSNNFRMDASNHGDARDTSLDQDTTSDQSNNESNYNRDILEHILPDIFGVSKYQNDSEIVFEQNNYMNYRVPSKLSGTCLYTAKVECDPCHCSDKSIIECFTAPESSSRNEFASTIAVMIRDWGEVLKMFSLDMLSWSQCITSLSIECCACDVHLKKDTIFDKPMDYFNVNNKHYWMKFRELVEEEAARRRKQSPDEGCSSRNPFPPPPITYTKKNTFPKPSVNLPKCNTQDNININRNEDNCNQWINGKVLEHLLENKSKTNMDVTDWKELRRSLKRDEQKWSMYRKRADRKH